MIRPGGPPGTPDGPTLVSALAPEHDRGQFTCGTAALDRYLREQAGQDVSKRVAAVFVLTAPPERAVLGFYTLAATSLRLSELPATVAKRLPKYPDVPSTLLGRLAVDVRVRGRGFDQRLLANALRRGFEATRAVASALVLVDAKDAAAVTFYQGHGFLPLTEQPRRLFLPMRAVKALGGTTL